LPTILDQIPHSTTADEARFIEIVNAAVASGELPKFQEWNKTTVKEYTAGRKKRVAKEKKEAIEAEQAARDLGVWEEFYGDGAQARKKGKDSRDDEAEEVEAESAEQRKRNGEKRKKRKPAAAVDENDTDEDTSTLAALIQSRQKARSGVMDALFDKYSKMSNEDDEEIDMASRGGKRQKKGKVDGSKSKNQTDGSVDDSPALVSSRTWVQHADLCSIRQCCHAGRRRIRSFPSKTVR
jgi:DnaJ family protein C protein 9